MRLRLLLATLLSLQAFIVLHSAFAAENPTLVVSVPEQKLYVFDENGHKIASYRVSTSKFGIGDTRNSYATPAGQLEVTAKIGYGAEPGSVFHGCRQTGEICPPNAPGRDPIVTRILRLRGLEPQNAGALSRGIYIHGTPDERAMATTEATQAGLLWLVVNRHVLATRQRFPDSAVLLSHEHFCGDPHGQMARVTRSLGIVYSDTMREAVTRATGGDVVIPPADKVQFLVRNTAAMVGEWRDRVSARDEAELRMLREPLYQQLVGTDWLGRPLSAASSDRDTARVAVN